MSYTFPGEVAIIYGSPGITYICETVEVFQTLEVGKTTTDTDTAIDMRPSCQLRTSIHLPGGETGRDGSTGGLIYGDLPFVCGGQKNAQQGNGYIFDTCFIISKSISVLHKTMY